MNILVVGNILKDIYLNIDSRTENFETDKNNTKWLDLAFNASEHHFFSRESSLGGAAVTLEVLNKLGLKAGISGSNVKMDEDGLTPDQPIKTHRYILVTDGHPSYFTPSSHPTTNFETPNDFYDYIYIDRSAHLSATATKRILSYLDLSANTKLVIYLQNFDNNNITNLISRANLIFQEHHKSHPGEQSLLETYHVSPDKIVHISDNQLSYLDIKEPVHVERIDLLTHLSAYSIATATILGSFILGNSVEESLRLARINMENAKLNASLSLEELKKISSNQNPSDNLALIATNLVLHPKGILAADESGGSIHKKFDQLNIADTYENRRDYRNIFFTTPGLEKYVNGVILFDETARQLADDGRNFVDYLTSKRIIPGIKVDQGLEKINNTEETYTKGLDGLHSRLQEYYRMGLRFAKWRAAFELRLDDEGNILTPTNNAIETNCQILAKYASACQANGIVPIVEPELVYDGYYDIDQSANITSKILNCLFSELEKQHVDLQACILKVNMVIAGKQFETPSTPEEVGAKTAEVLKKHVPENLAGIVFLSGGQTPEQATNNLAAINKNGPFPWPVTFSFARALQDPALYAWNGDNNNIEKARQAFLDRLIQNSKAL